MSALLNIRLNYERYEKHGPMTHCSFVNIRDNSRWTNDAAWSQFVSAFESLLSASIVPTCEEFSILGEEKCWFIIKHYLNPITPTVK